MDKKCLTGHQIFETLNTEDWQWNSNDQPSVYLVTAILEQLPVHFVGGGFDRMQIGLTRDLTGPEQFALSMLNPDQITRDGWQYDFWWD